LLLPAGERTFLGSAGEHFHAAVSTSPRDEAELGPEPHGKRLCDLQGRTKGTRQILRVAIPEQLQSLPHMELRERIPVYTFQTSCNNQQRVSGQHRDEAIYIDRQSLLL